jgi:hypothetical protein
MKVLLSVLVMLPAFVATGAAAQGVNLSGRYICVKGCSPEIPGQVPFAYVTQNGWSLNMVNEAGAPSRAWVDWPGRIWADNYQQGAIVSPDGMVIQFDRGTVWQRDLGLAPVVVVHRTARVREAPQRPPSQ